MFYIIHLGLSDGWMSVYVSNRRLHYVNMLETYLWEGFIQCMSSTGIDLLKHSINPEFQIAYKRCKDL